MLLRLDELAQFLDRFLAVHPFDSDQRGIYRPSSRPIRRLGLSLEPWSQLSTWVNRERLDALFLHRPWDLQLEHLPPDLGIVAYHLAFDERLTLTFNPRLGQILGMASLEVLGEKAGRPIGMLGEVELQSIDQCCQQLRAIFGNVEEVLLGTQPSVYRIAIVGAMTDSLVRQAAERGANLYITGQFRKVARQALLETGLSLVVVGHRRSEEWGLRALAGVVRERWAGLEVLLPPQESAVLGGGADLLPSLE
ncbi:Nif3-like dinuclear metal center hexameric protein [Leptolyngbya sp. FACHB-261]|uniref:Nif3-like dinuclear metal center hexameric protein n=1 Tax=Leptolyngbya sp. FACHB-261 TaxID=2692806 RepID=UPI001685914B|nr:Nif3-like dinuclear metal center hexameric protein [Leptolyngbya sp. FACHB-261]MBD2099848.1 Nif3-like dinuclear metal center hexameric protein [Leptolyngbya sp. FACHB-261]